MDFVALYEAEITTKLIELNHAKLKLKVFEYVAASIPEFPVLQLHGYLKNDQYESLVNILKTGGYNSVATGVDDVIQKHFSQAS